MKDTNKQISGKTENINRASTVKSTGVEIPLYRRYKGKVYRASGSWQTTKGEKRLIETLGCMFFFGLFIGLIMLFIHPGNLAFIFLGIGILGAAGTFISLFAIVFRKHNETPMEGHYYDTDYKYNAFSGEETDNTREITKEEFFGKK